MEYSREEHVEKVDKTLAFWGEKDGWEFTLTSWLFVHSSWVIWGSLKTRKL